MWDAGSEVKLQPLWRHYYDVANAVVFVLDASHKESAAEASDKLHSLLSTSSNMEHIVLILANKQDLGNCMTEDEIIKIFRLRNSPRMRWRIQPARIKEWYGVTEGMEWLSKEVCK